jgi:hypothetical protein
MLVLGESGRAIRLTIGSRSFAQSRGVFLVGLEEPLERPECECASGRRAGDRGTRHPVPPSPNSSSDRQPDRVDSWGPKSRSFTQNVKSPATVNENILPLATVIEKSLLGGAPPAGAFDCRIRWVVALRPPVPRHTCRKYQCARACRRRDEVRQAMMKALSSIQLSQLDIHNIRFERC